MQPEPRLSFNERLQRDADAAHQQAPAAVVAPSLRERSLASALSAGLPALRDDDWRYTRLRPLAAAALLPAAAQPQSSADAMASLALPETLPGFLRLVYVNGRAAPELSATAEQLQGVQRIMAGNAGSIAAPWPQADLQAGPSERFAWLNDIFATDSAQLLVTGQAQLELLFISTQTPDAGARYPRLDLRLQAGAQLTLVERHLGSGGADALTNVSVQVDLQQSSTLRHYRVQALNADALFIDTLLATLGPASRYDLTFVQQGAATARSNLRLQLQGDGSQLSLHGISLTDARGSNDTVIQVEHIGRNSHSEQVLRGVANGQSSIGLASRVDVAASARGADSRQSLKGLIGAAGAEVNLRPQLEINTDEVKASHGATTGSLDENTLFYLLSRGLDPQTARKLLEWAFIGDVMSHIDIAALRRQIELATVSQLGNAAALEALL